MRAFYGIDQDRVISMPIPIYLLTRFLFRKTTLFNHALDSERVWQVAVGCYKRARPCQNRRENVRPRGDSLLVSASSKYLTWKGEMNDASYYQVGLYEMRGS